MLTWMQRLRLWPKSCQEWWATLPGMSSLSKKACTTSTVLSVDPVHWQHNKSGMLPASQLMLRCRPTRLFGAWGVGASSAAACRCQQLARLHPTCVAQGPARKLWRQRLQALQNFGCFVLGYHVEANARLCCNLPPQGQQQNNPADSAAGPHCSCFHQQDTQSCQAPDAGELSLQARTSATQTP